jgi:hypothetical protein
MTPFHLVTLAIELIEAGVRCPEALQITSETASSLIDALQRERLGTMTTVTHSGGMILPGDGRPGDSDRKPLSQFLLN